MAFIQGIRAEIIVEAPRRFENLTALGDSLGLVVLDAKAEERSPQLNPVVDAHR